MPDNEYWTKWMVGSQLPIAVESLRAMADDLDNQAAELRRQADALETACKTAENAQLGH